MTAEHKPTLIYERDTDTSWTIYDAEREEWAVVFSEELAALFADAPRLKGLVAELAGTLRAYQKAWTRAPEMAATALSHLRPGDEA